MITKTISIIIFGLIVILINAIAVFKLISLFIKNKDSNYLILSIINFTCIIFSIIWIIRLI